MTVFWAGAQNAPTRCAEEADVRPALAATRAETDVIEAATMFTLEFALITDDSNRITFKEGRRRGTVQSFTFASIIARPSG